MSELQQITGLFRNESKKGEVFYSGEDQEGRRWVLFRNKFWKEGSKQPYFNLKMQEKDDQQQD